MHASQLRHRGADSSHINTDSTAQEHNSVTSSLPSYFRKLFGGVRAAAQSATRSGQVNPNTTASLRQNLLERQTSRNSISTTPGNVMENNTDVPYKMLSIFALLCFSIIGCVSYGLWHIGAPITIAIIPLIAPSFGFTVLFTMFYLSSKYPNSVPDQTLRRRVARYIFHPGTSPRTRRTLRQLAFSDRDFTERDYESLLELDRLPSTEALQEFLQGASDDLIDRIPFYIFDEPEKELKEESEESPKHSVPSFAPKENEDTALSCSICLEYYVSGEHLRVLPCMHQFHSLCVDKWLRKYARCPICKFAIV
eukprot:jgi/Galph1/4502/GphlegSOOS_G3187.1